jgi:CysZ protein
MTSTPASASTPPGHGLSGFARGLTYPFRGALFVLRRPSTWGRAAIPALVNGLLLILFVGLAMFFLDELRDLLIPERLEAIEGWKGTAVTVVATILSFVLCVLAAVVVALICAAALAGPFAEYLSERVEDLYRGEPTDDEPFSLRTLGKDLLRGIAGALGRLVIFGSVYVPLLLASLLPVIGLLFAALTIVYSGFFLAMNFADPVLERRKWNLSAKLGWARANLAAWLGFGLACFGVMFIPVANLLITPALVAGGTLLFVDVQRAEAEAVNA